MNGSRWTGGGAALLEAPVEGLLEDLQASLQSIAALGARVGEGAQATLQSLAERVPESALVLSGGGALGFFHLGVARALFEAGLLPRVLAGASMGAMIAGGLATRTEAELSRGFQDPSWIERHGLRWLGPKELLRQRSLCCPEQMSRVVEQNIGAHTFREAYARTGRILAVAVTSARPGHPVRLLSYESTPHTPIPRAALASGALPFFFPRVELDGEHYLDGSFGGDVPTERLTRAFGVGHFVVSQVNAYALPFLAASRIAAARLLGRWARHTAGSAAHHSGLVLRRTPLGSPLHLMGALGRQNYRGDLTITPNLRPGLLARVMANPSLDELRDLIDAGATAAARILPDLARRQRLRRAIEGALTPGADAASVPK